MAKTITLSRNSVISARPRRLRRKRVNVAADDPEGGPRTTSRPPPALR